MPRWPGYVVSAETRAKIGAAFKGKSLSAEHRAAISRGRTGYVRTPEYNAKLGVAIGNALRGRKNPEHGVRVAKALADGKIPKIQTRPERTMLRLLYEAGFHVLAQRQFGRYCVDAYLPEDNLVFEADGDYWHSRQEREKPGYRFRRDRYLGSLGLTVVHLTESELLRMDEIR